jgi:LacI family transcriptional regulator
MPRTTIGQLAKASGVSIATVNRVLSGSTNVRADTMARVKSAAEEIGFYGVGSIRGRVSTTKPKYRFGFLLHQAGRVFYQETARALKAAAERTNDAIINIEIEFLDDLSPQNTAARMLALGETCDAIGVVAAVHPLVTQAVNELEKNGLPVFGLISQLSASGNVHYVGLDNWKVGRTSAWVFDNVCKKPGKLGILVGNHRYRCQEMNEAGFRSYFREHAPEFTLLEPLSTFESSVVSQDLTERLISEHPDLTGLYVAGGGVTGAITALRRLAKPNQIALVGHQLLDVTRQALLDGYMSVAISQPLDATATRAIAGMLQALRYKDSSNITAILPFEIFTRENI